MGRVARHLEAAMARQMRAVEVLKRQHERQVLVESAFDLRRLAVELVESVVVVVAVAVDSEALGRASSSQV